MRIDTSARVLRRDGTPIGNLFAGGGAAAGISGRSGGQGYSSGNGLLTALGEQLFSAGYWKTLIYAAILMVVIMLLPGGLVDLPRRLRGRRKTKPAAIAQAR